MCTAATSSFHATLQRLARADDPTAVLVHVDHERGRAIFLSGDGSPIARAYTMDEGEPVALVGGDDAGATLDGYTVALRRTHPAAAARLEAGKRLAAATFAATRQREQEMKAVSGVSAPPPDGYAIALAKRAAESAR